MHRSTLGGFFVFGALTVTLDSMGNASQEIAARVAGYLTKYMSMLGIHGAPPTIRVLDRPDESWLARSIWDLKRPRETVLEFQTQLFDAPNHEWLERSIAHELIHYRDVLKRSGHGADEPDDIDHGPSFHQGAAHINAIMGKNFVTAEVVKLPSGALVSKATVQAAASREKLLLALGLGGAALFGWMLAHRAASPERRFHNTNERGSYG